MDAGPSQILKTDTLTGSADCFAFCGGPAQ